MNSTVQIKLYDLFRKDLNLADDKAKAFVEAIDEAIHDDLKTDMPNFKSFFKEDFEHVHKEVKDVNKDVQRLDVKISETKSDIIRWMMAFWFGQITIITGLLMYFFKTKG